MPLPAIVLEDLWKTYRVPAPRTARGLRGWLRRPPGQPLHAVRGVTLEVVEGEVFGVVGRNGAGKSTLLRILSRITEPSRGQVVVYGTTASLLEVGTGFHPEMTGRENVYLNAAIHGLRRAEVRRRLDSIVEFSGVGDLLDLPVKRYSSGMYLRLAFSVAAHLEPDVLIVDEILAVGDAEFQRRCLGRLQSLRELGRTVVFVSHDLHAVRQLCTRAAWMDAGEVRATGSAADVVGRYLAAGVAPEAAWRPAPSPGEPFRYREVCVVDARGRPRVSQVAAGEGFGIEMTYEVLGPLPPARLTVMLRTADGQLVLGSAETDASPALDRSWTRGVWRSTCLVPGHLLAPGRYLVSVAAPRTDGPPSVHEAVLAFDVTTEGSLQARDGRQGFVLPLLAWRCEGLGAGTEPVRAGGVA